MNDNWQHIPRKLRAALVQIAGIGTPTISEETKQELLRRDWIIEGMRRIHIRRNGYIIPTDRFVMGWIFNHKGCEVWNTRPNRGQVL